NVVRGTRIQPNGEALVVGISKENLPFKARLITYAEILVDANGNGVVELKLENAVSSGSVWAVADLSSGKWRVAGPDGSPMRKKQARGAVGRDGFGSLNRLVDQTQSLAFFVARAGVGAWRGVAADGGPTDLGAPDDRSVEVDLGGLLPIGATTEFDELAPGDLILAFHPQRLEFSAGRVRGNGLSDITDGEDEQ
ncbi:MAG: hypothetical protein GY769_06230, partial [bacterium]|nr:hypothetical protein [bacterium]